MAQSGRRPIRTGSSPSWIRRPSGSTSAPVAPAGPRRSRRRSTRSPMRALRIDGERDADRTDEVVLRLARVITGGFAELARRVSRGIRRSARSRLRTTLTMKSFGTTVPRTPSVRPMSISRTRRRPISTGCRPLRNALPNPPSTSRSSLRSNRWSPIASDRICCLWANLVRSRASGGIGRRAGFRFLCPQGRGGSSPPSRTRVA